MTRHYTYERTVPAGGRGESRHCGSADNDPRHVAEQRRRVESLAAWVAAMQGPPSGRGNRRGTACRTNDGRVFGSLRRCAEALGVPLSRLQSAMDAGQPVAGVRVMQI